MSLEWVTWFDDQSSVRREDVEGINAVVDNSISAKQQRINRDKEMQRALDKFVRQQERLTRELDQEGSWFTPSTTPEQREEAAKTLFEELVAAEDNITRRQLRDAIDEFFYYLEGNYRLVPYRDDDFAILATDNGDVDWIVPDNADRAGFFGYDPNVPGFQWVESAANPGIPRFNSSDSTLGWASAATTGGHFVDITAGAVTLSKATLNALLPSAGADNDILWCDAGTWKALNASFGVFGFDSVDLGYYEGGYIWAYESASIIEGRWKIPFGDLEDTSTTTGACIVDVSAGDACSLVSIPDLTFNAFSGTGSGIYFIGFNSSGVVQGMYEIGDGYI